MSYAYGICPKCGAPGVSRERRPNGNDQCTRGHVYPSREALDYQQMSSSMKILALDLATRTGWAHSDGPSGVQDFSLKRGESSGMLFLKFRGWLDRVYSDAEFELVAYEQPHLRGGYATELLAGMVGILLAWAVENGVEYAMRHSGEIKRHATGKGNANKEQMIEAARKIGWNPEDDNEADALWLLDLVQEELSC